RYPIHSRPPETIVAATDMPITWSSAAPPPSSAAAMMCRDSVVIGRPSCPLSGGATVLLVGNVSRIPRLKQEYVLIPHCPRGMGRSSGDRCAAPDPGGRRTTDRACGDLGAARGAR